MATNDNENIKTNNINDFPQPLDPNLLNKLQLNAENLGKELDDLMTSVQNSLHSICAFSLGYMDNYRKASEQLNESVSENVTGMYEFLKKVKQLNEELDGVDVIHNEIKDIKKTLDILELLTGKLTTSRKMNT